MVTVLGTRPELIKLAPVICEFQENPKFEPMTWLTGQHTEMIESLLPLFPIHINRRFTIGNSGTEISAVLSAAISGISVELEQIRPDALLVQGDTTSALGAGLAGFLNRIPVIHLEAGLRTGDLADPFPEEANRKILSTVASLHLAPTGDARTALEREGIKPQAITVTGNTVIDSLNQLLRNSPGDHLGEFQPWVERKQVVLITAHRRESWDSGIAQIAASVADLATEHPDMNFIFSLHKNPVVRRPIVQSLSCVQNVYLTEPVSYDIFVQLLKRASLIITDSGGIQEEATFLGIPMVVVRDKTERPQASSLGVGALVGTQRSRIIEAANSLLKKTSKSEFLPSKANLAYGDGKSAQRVLESIESFLKHEPLPADYVAT